MERLTTVTQASLWLKSRVRGDLCTDSRKVSAGDGFIAWPGSAADPRKYIPDALQKAVSACLFEADGADVSGYDCDKLASIHGIKQVTGLIASSFYGHPSRELSVIAVTGTNGKTSTAWWLAQALSALPAEHSMPCGVIGTLGVGRASEGAVMATGFTTPDPVVLHKTLHQFCQQGLKACAMEASSIGIEEDRMAGTSLRVAVFTNFTQDHLDYHGTMAAYWQAKRRLFAWTGLQTAVINIDDERGMELALELKQADVRLLTTSMLTNANLRAVNIRYAAQGLEFDVQEGSESHTLQSRLIGLYNISNLLGVIGAMRALDVPLAAAVAACAHLKPVPGRMDCIGGNDEPLVAVDYAHTPDALEKALKALQPMTKARGGKLWCVFGCGGDRDASKRPLMGAIAAREADNIVITSDNPRSERPETIVAQILLGCAKEPHVRVQVDRARAIDEVIQCADKNDIVLIAGKGHEDYQEISGVRHPFLDKALAQKALEMRR